MHYLLLFCAILSTLIVFFIFVFLFLNVGDFFNKVPLDKFLFDDEWSPTAEKPKFGAFNIIAGTILVTIGAMIISIPLGIATAIFIAEIAPPKTSRFLKGAVEILSGIPSVVYGFFGIIILNVWISENFNEAGSGASWLSGSLILAVMALPIIVSVSEDAIRSVPKEYKEASLAMGSTRWQMISKVVLPAAISGITAAIILGIGRAVGETMAVLMVTGNCNLFPEPITNIFTCVRTITGTIGIEMGEVPEGSLHFKALFALALILFIMTFIINSLSSIILSRINRKFQGESKSQSRFKITLPKKVVEYRYYILYIVLIGIFGWVLTTWFGVLNGILITFAFVGFFILLKIMSVKNQQRLVFLTIMLMTLVVLCSLGIILYYIIDRGLPAITWEFLTESPDDLGREGGIFPAIIGTLYLVGGAIFYAVPIGMAAGIYLSEYAKDGRLIRFIRTGIDNLNGTPSIVFGLFGFAFFVLILDMGISMLAGQLTLALMILPTIIRTTEEAVKSIPVYFREGSLALGSTKWQSISRVVLPAAMPGIITGVILGMGRSAGETAPILFTAAVFRQRTIPRFVIQPVMALTYHLFILSTAIPDSETAAAGTALVLLTLVAILYSVAIFIRNRYQKKKKW
ncbi:MAG: phosphate ABC transporter permease PstA [Promethearchaeota archaeon]|nr:MAG: phosphate ABC transporter permease PstA [Candidatus Lokiarchaeota archaeon]